MTAKRRFEISIIAALIFSVLISMARFEAQCAEIKENVFRLHILANSDSETDQELKLKVRDRILQLDIYDNTTTRAEAIRYSQENIDHIINEAEKVVENEGFDYKVTAEVTKCYFNTRVYENFTLPAGTYDALRIKIGRAEGKNWWCVIFPKLCLGACTNFGNEISDSSKEIVTNSDEYTVKFKVVEVFEGIKDKLNSFFS